MSCSSLSPSLCVPHLHFSLPGKCSSWARISVQTAGRHARLQHRKNYFRLIHITIRFNCSLIGSNEVLFWIVLTHFNPLSTRMHVRFQRGWFCGVQNPEWNTLRVVLLLDTCTESSLCYMYCKRCMWLMWCHTLVFDSTFWTFIVLADALLVFGLQAAFINYTGASHRLTYVLIKVKGIHTGSDSLTAHQFVSCVTHRYPALYLVMPSITHLEAENSFLSPAAFSPIVTECHRLVMISAACPARKCSNQNHKNRNEVQFGQRPAPSTETQWSSL